MKIRANVSYSERTNTMYHRDFEVIESLPEVGDDFRQEEVTEISEAHLDIEQGRPEVYDYYFYEVVTNDEDGEEYVYYVAVKKDIEAEIREECIGKTWEWCSQDEYYESLLFDSAEAIDGVSGNNMRTSGDCIVNLGLGLAVSGHVEVGEDEDVITIDPEAIVYDPEAGVI